MILFYKVVSLIFITFKEVIYFLLKVLLSIIINIIIIIFPTLDLCLVENRFDSWDYLIIKKTLLYFAYIWISYWLVTFLIRSWCLIKFHVLLSLITLRKSKITLLRSCHCCLRSKWHVRLLFMNWIILEIIRTS